VDDSGRQDFEEFVAARSTSLIRLAYVLTADQHAAEDLLQSALTKAAAHWGRIRTSPDAYVRRIMYREQVGRWRSRARRPETTLACLPELPAEDLVPGIDARLALQQALRALPAGKRAVLALRYLEDLPEAQVADILGCSVGTVRSQTHKAVRQLRAIMAAQGLTSTEVHS
jgi:RNA polymerase sigma-70 factor (sigma-E family)